MIHSLTGLLLLNKISLKLFNFILKNNCLQNKTAFEKKHKQNKYLFFIKTKYCLHNKSNFYITFGEKGNS